MDSYDVQNVALKVDARLAFDYIAEPRNLPLWTSAFAEVSGKGALLRTPAGEVPIGLVVAADARTGTVDWVMTFPDGSRATAFSRVVRLDENRCLYSFTLTPPPGPLEALEGAMEQQSRTLAGELVRLKTLLEAA